MASSVTLSKGEGDCSLCGCVNNADKSPNKISRSRIDPFIDDAHIQPKHARTVIFNKNDSFFVYESVSL